jgi:membrane protein required for colicin V production
MNPADAAVIGIILLSGIIALAIGFVRTVLIMLSWGGAALVTLWGFAPARPYGRNLIDNPLAADILTGVAVFVIALIVFYAIAHFISVRVRASAFAALDRTLGLVLGLILGCAMVSLLYLGLSWVLPPSEQPAWAREARTRPLVEAGAGMVCRMAPKEFCAQGRAAGGRAGQINDTLDPHRVFRALGTPAAKPPAPAGETGYKQDERRELDRLLQNVGPGGVRAGETQPAAGQR